MNSWYSTPYFPWWTKPTEWCSYTNHTSTFLSLLNFGPHPLPPHKTRHPWSSWFPCLYMVMQMKMKQINHLLLRWLEECMLNVLIHDISSLFCSHGWILKSIMVGLHSSSHLLSSSTKCWSDPHLCQPNWLCFWKMKFLLSHQCCSVYFSGSFISTDHL